MSRRSLVLWYSCLVKSELSHLLRLPPRLKDVAELIPDKVDMIADIGTDHGLLAYHMAKQRPCTKVIGIDASSAALEQGANALPRLPNLEFRLGNGLQGLQQHTDQLDVAICMAGIGVNTMTDILSPEKLLNLNCQTIVLQPAGSRPRLLALLYKHLSLAQWSLESESILYDSRRWYLSSLWHLKKKEEMSTIPGLRLLQAQDAVAQRWSLHHCKWIVSDWKAGSTPTESEQQWMETFCRDSCFKRLKPE